MAIGSLVGAALCASGAGKMSLSQYDQVSAEVNGTLDTDKLVGWLQQTNANTMSFLLWDTNGHQYLDLVRFLEATKDHTDANGAAALQVWVTLIPVTETIVWQNESACSKW